MRNQQKLTKRRLEARCKTTYDKDCGIIKCIIKTVYYKYCGKTTVSILLVRKANAKGSVSGFEIAPPSKGGGSDKHLAVN